MGNGSFFLSTHTKTLATHYIKAVSLNSKYHQKQMDSSPQIHLPK